MAALLSRIARRALWPSPPKQLFPSSYARTPESQPAHVVIRGTRYDGMWFSSRVSPAFDTHDLVKRLVASGFTTDQAEVVLESMKQASEQYANTADSMYPTKIEMIEKNLAYKADFAAMKSDLVLMLKQDVALLKSEIHKVWHRCAFAHPQCCDFICVSVAHRSWKRSSAKRPLLIRQS